MLVGASVFLAYVESDELQICNVGLGVYHLWNPTVVLRAEVGLG